MTRVDHRPLVTVCMTDVNGRDIVIEARVDRVGRSYDTVWYAEVVRWRLDDCDAPDWQPASTCTVCDDDVELLEKVALAAPDDDDGPDEDDLRERLASVPDDRRKQLREEGRGR